VRVLGPGKDWEVSGFVAILDEPTRSHDECVVSFRGSSNAENAMADLYFKRAYWGGQTGVEVSWCPGCLVHTGFAEAYDELKTEMLAALENLSCKRISVTGHSLGAAVATLATLDLRAGHGLAVPTSMLFGAPRVGNDHFVTAFVAAADRQGLAAPAWRIVHYHDPVPRLPPALPEGFPFSYRHVPREVYYTDENSSAFQVCDGSGEDPSCSDSVPLLSCLNFDHLTYLNVTFAIRHMPSACIASNITRFRELMI